VALEYLEVGGASVCHQAHAQQGLLGPVATVGFDNCGWNIISIDSPWKQWKTPQTAAQDTWISSQDISSSGR